MDKITRRDILQYSAAILASTAIADPVIGSSAETSVQTSDPELIEADETAGFNFPYFLYVPQNVGEQPIVVESVNSGAPSDDMDVHIEAAERRAQFGTSRMISDELGAPFIVPVIKDPRSGPASDSRTQSLDTEVMKIEDGRYARIDRQVVNMVDDARERLADRGYDIPEEFMLNGFSQSGNFANNLALLQPDRIASVTAGGLNGLAILPRDKARGETINFQIGTADYEDLTGKPFDKETWREIPQLGYIGANERIPFDDTIPYSDVWGDRAQAQRAVDVYGFDMQRERMVYSDVVYNEEGAKTRLEVYDNYGHDTSGIGIGQDILNFHARHTETATITARRGFVKDAEELELDVFVPAGSSETQEVRAFVNGSDASVEPAEISRGELNRIQLSLSSSLELDDMVEIGVFEPGETRLQDALFRDQWRVRFGFSFQTIPEPGDTSIEIAYDVADQPVRLDLVTDNGSLYWQRQASIRRFERNESGKETFEFDARDEGVPFESGDNIQLVASLPDEPRGVDATIDEVTVGEEDTFNPATQALGEIDHDDVEVDFNSPPTVGATTIDIECSVDESFHTNVGLRLFPDTGSGRWGIDADWDFENGWQQFPTTPPGQTTSGEYDVPSITFAPADEPALGSTVELRAYPDDWRRLEDYATATTAIVSGVRFTEPPMAGTDTVAIRYLYPDTFAQTGQLQLHINGDEVDTVDGISPGTMDDQTLVIGTTQEIEPDDEITVSISPEGETPFDEAQETVLPTDAGTVAFASDVEALDQTVTLDYHLDPDVEIERFATLRLYTEETSEWGIYLGRVDPGSNAVESFEINLDEVCVPFQPDTGLTVKLVSWDDPYATLPLAEASVAVGESVDHDPEEDADQEETSEEDTDQEETSEENTDQEGEQDDDSQEDDGEPDGGDQVEEDVEDDESADDGSPGFGVGGAVTAIGGVAYMIQRRLEQEDEVEPDC